MKDFTKECQKLDYENNRTVQGVEDSYRKKIDKLEENKNKEISNVLYISQATVHTHLNNIYKKIPNSWRVWIRQLKN